MTTSVGVPAGDHERGRDGYDVVSWDEIHRGTGLDAVLGSRGWRATAHRLWQGLVLVLWCQEVRRRSVVGHAPARVSKRHAPLKSESDILSGWLEGAARYERPRTEKPSV